MRGLPTAPPAWLDLTEADPAWLDLVELDPADDWDPFAADPTLDATPVQSSRWGCML